MREAGAGRVALHPLSHAKDSTMSNDTEEPKPRAPCLNYLVPTMRKLCMMLMLMERSADLGLDVKENEK